MKKITIVALLGVASLLGTKEAEFDLGYCLFDPDLGTASIFDESENTVSSIHMRNPSRLEYDEGYSGDTSVSLSAQPLSGQWDKITVLPDVPICELSGGGEKRFYEAIETELPDFRSMLKNQPY